MCELFGGSSKLPTNVTFSLSVLGERGGRLGPHKDGWGIAFNGGRDFRIIKEAAPASNSACLVFIEGHDFKGQTVIPWSSGLFAYLLMCIAEWKDKEVGAKGGFGPTLTTIKS